MEDALLLTEKFEEMGSDVVKPRVATSLEYAK